MTGWVRCFFKVVDHDAGELAAYTKRVLHAEEVQSSLREQAIRWREKERLLRTMRDHTAADALLAAGVVAYGGVFGAAHRARLLTKWKAIGRQCELPHSRHFRLTRFCLPAVGENRPCECET